MSLPDITLFAAAVRPQCWMDFYRSIGDNHATYEIIFVGPNEPDYVLPDNVQFIKSFTKPVQCFEIARRIAKSPLVMNFVDDCEFCTNHPLDTLLDTYYSHLNEKLLVSCRYMQNGVDRSELDHYFFCEDHSSPKMPMHSLLSRLFFDQLGGIDRNFVAVFWDLDVAMRVYAAGGDIIFSDVYVNEDKSKRADSDLCAKFGGPDRGLLEYLWTYNRKCHLNRTQPVEPFSDYKLVEQTQGPRGKW